MITPVCTETDWSGWNNLLRLDLFLDFLNKVGRFATLAQFGSTLSRFILLIEFKNSNAFEILTEDTPVQLHADFSSCLLGFPLGRFFLSGFFLGSLFLRGYLLFCCFRFFGFCLGLTTFRAIGARGGCKVLGGLNLD